MGEMTDEELEAFVERWHEHKARPSGGSSARATPTWWAEAFLPAPVKRERPPPPPVKVIMRNGVYVDGLPQEDKITAPECPGIVSSCEEARELNPLPSVYETDALPNELACVTELVGAVRDRTPRVRKQASGAIQREWTARGLCRHCCKPFVPGTNKYYHDHCAEARNARARERRKGEFGL